MDTRTTSLISGIETTLTSALYLDYCNVPLCIQMERWSSLRRTAGTPGGTSVNRPTDWGNHRKLSPSSTSRVCIGLWRQWNLAEITQKEFQSWCVMCYKAMQCNVIAWQDITSHQNRDFIELFWWKLIPALWRAMKTVTRRAFTFLKGPYTAL